MRLKVLLQNKPEKDVYIDMAFVPRRIALHRDKFLRPDILQTDRPCDAGRCTQTAPDTFFSIDTGGIFTRGDRIHRAYVDAHAACCALLLVDGSLVPARGENPFGLCVGCKAQHLAAASAAVADHIRFFL